MPRALLIDDQEWTVERLRAVLDASGLETDYASTVDDALELLQEVSYDVVVTDFDLDLLNGTQVLRLLRGSFGSLEVGEGPVDAAAVRAFDPDLAAVIGERFATFSEYEAFVRRHRDAVLCLFTGNRPADLEDQEALDGVLVAAKPQRSRAGRAERELAAAIAEQLGLLR